MYFLGDIGGTKTIFALSLNLQKIDKKEFFLTPTTYKDFLHLVKNFKEKNKIKKIKKACLGIAGVLNNQKDKIIYSPNLKFLENQLLKKDLEKILNTQVILENDAILAGIGESQYGAGKKFKIIAYITISTGVGGAKIINQSVDKNFFGFEPGHSYFILDKKPIEFEKIISGRAIEKIYGKKPEEIKNKKIWQKINYLISLFLVNVSLFWSPEIIILGGSIVKALNFKLLNKNFYKLIPFKKKIKIRKCQLKNLSVIYGCLSYLKNKVKK
jgi:glucokinase